MSYQVSGMDISSQQRNILNMIHKGDFGLEFVICKATYGDEDDNSFSQNWKTAKEKFDVRGTYHSYLFAQTPQQNADQYIKALNENGGLQEDDLPPVLQFDGYSCFNSQESKFWERNNHQKIQEDLLSFLTSIEKQTGRTPMIFVSPSDADGFFKDKRFAEYPLWIAHWDVKSPRIPKVWADKGKEWTFWQKSGKDRTFGQPTDLDKFNGDRRALKQFIANSKTNT